MKKLRELEEGVVSEKTPSRQLVNKGKKAGAANDPGSGVLVSASVPLSVAT